MLWSFTQKDVLIFHALIFNVLFALQYTIRNQLTISYLMYVWAV